MYLIFVNSLERKSETKTEMGKVSIHEEHGKWTALWTSPDLQGTQQVDCWYEGTSWSDLLGNFKYGVAQKLADGFIPLVQDFSFQTEKSEGQNRALLLEFYSELHMDEPLYQALKEWRLKRSKTEKKAPYLIATNRMLKMVATFVPHTREELMQLPGFGKQRSMQLANELCAITGTMTQPEKFPLIWVKDRVDQPTLQSWLLKQKEERAKRELDAGQRRKAMLLAMTGGQTFVAACEACGINLRDGAQLLEDLERDGYELGGWLQLQWDCFPNDMFNKENALEGFEELSDRFLKPVLLRQFTEQQLAGKNQDEMYAWLRIVRLYYRNSLEKTQAA
jgi:hypothetical protein